MRVLMLIAAAGAFLAAAAPAADKVADYSGTWGLDPDKTRANLTTPVIREIKTEMGGLRPRTADETGPDASGNLQEVQIRDLTLVISQTLDALQVARRFPLGGEMKTVIQKFSLDGSQCFNPASDGRGGFVSRTTWKNKKLTHSGTQTVSGQGPDTNVHVSEEYSVSKNRKHLTVKTTRTTPQGVITLKQVLIRNTE